MYIPGYPSVGLDLEFQTLDSPVTTSLLRLRNVNAGIHTPELTFAPQGNCGIMAFGHPSQFSWMPLDLGQWWLKCIEAYSRYRSKSVLLCNDAVNGLTWNTLKKYGEGWQFVELGWNRNYDTTNKHRVGLIYKNIGEFCYPNEYGFGNTKEFNALPNDYPRG